METTDPRAAGADALFAVPSALVIEDCPSPDESAVKTPGAVFSTRMAIGDDWRPPTDTTTFVDTRPYV